MAERLNASSRLLPRGVHQHKGQRDGGQKAQNVEFFTEPRGKGAGDDVAIGVIQKVKVGVQGFVKKIDGQGRAEQKGQHLRHPAHAGAVSARHQQHRVEHQQGVDADRVQVDEGEPPGHIPPAGAQQSQCRAGDAQGVQLLLAPAAVGEGVVQADEHVDAAQVQRQIAPVPLAGAGHAQQQGGLIGQQGRRDPHQNVPPGARCAAAVPPHHAQKEQRRQRQLYEMDSAEQRVALIARTVFGGGDVIGFPEVRHGGPLSFRAYHSTDSRKPKRYFLQNAPKWVHSLPSCGIL